MTSAFQEILPRVLNQKGCEPAAFHVFYTCAESFSTLSCSVRCSSHQQLPIALKKNCQVPGTETHLLKIEREEKAPPKNSYRRDRNVAFFMPHPVCPSGKVVKAQPPDKSSYIIAACPLSTFNQHSNNPCESFNASIMKFRECPNLLFLHLIWNYKAQLFTRHREEAATYPSNRQLAHLAKCNNVIAGYEAVIHCKITGDVTLKNTVGTEFKVDLPTKPSRLARATISPMWERRTAHRRGATCIREVPHV